MAQGISKVSVALLILRFTGYVVMWRRWFLYVCIFSSLIFSTISVILLYVQCVPVSALWEPIAEAHCWNPEVQIRFAVFVGSRLF